MGVRQDIVTQQSRYMHSREELRADGVELVKTLKLLVWTKELFEKGSIILQSGHVQ